MENKMGTRQQNTPQGGVKQLSRYGWEEDAEKLWLMHFNRSLLASGIITQEEYGKVEAAITKGGLLNPKRRYSIMNKS